MNIHRIKLTTGPVQNKEMKESDVFEFCFDNNIVGLGWKLHENPEDNMERAIEIKEKTKQNSKDKAKAEIEKDCKNFNDGMKALKRVRKNELIWALGDSKYYVGRIIDDKYYYKENGDYDKYDIHHIKKCKWSKGIPIQDVPGKVISSFYGNGQTLRRIGNVNQIEEISKLIYNKYNREESEFIYEIDKAKIEDYWNLFSDQDIEEIVSLYLQIKKDYKIYITTKRRATKKYEFMMINKKRELATVQVKSGNTPLNIDDYIDDSKNMKIYLFAVNDKNTKENLDKKDNEPLKYKNIEIIKCKELDEFIKEHKDYLPDYIQEWINLVNEGSQLNER